MEYIYDLDLDSDQFYEEDDYGYDEPDGDYADAYYDSTYPDTDLGDEY